MAEQSYFAELRKRKVVRTALIYLAVAWGLTEGLVLIVDQLFLPQWVATLTVILFVIGFPIAMFLAWTFDVTPEGIQRTAVTSRRGKASIVLSMVLLLAGTAGLFLLIKPSLDDRAPASTVAGASPNSIAVLPFDFSGPNPDDGYLGSGLSDELRDQLARIAEIQIAARSSSKGSALTSPSLKENLSAKPASFAFFFAYSNRSADRSRIVTWPADPTAFARDIACRPVPPPASNP